MSSFLNVDLMLLVCLDKAKENKIIDIKYEVQGRIALGTTITAGFAGLMMQDRITGSKGLIWTLSKQSTC